MKKLFGAMGNVMLVLGGFLVVFFWTDKVSNDSVSRSPLSNLLNSTDVGVAHADVPYSQGTYGDSSGGGDSSGSSGDSGGCGGK